MALTRREPYEELGTVRGEIDWLFEHFFERTSGTMFSKRVYVRASPVEIADTKIVS